MIVKLFMSYDQFKNITIQQMESLVLIVEKGNFSCAARKVFLTQPFLTKYTKNLDAFFHEAGLTYIKH